MQQNLPQGFRNMMLEMRQGVAAIARDAGTIDDQRHILRQLVQVQEVCVACHRAYKLAPGEPVPTGAGRDAPPATLSIHNEDDSRQ
jgi:hypothetical protein